MNAKLVGKKEIRRENMGGDREGGTSKWFLAQTNNNCISWHPHSQTVFCSGFHRMERHIPPFHPYLSRPSSLWREPLFCRCILWNMRPSRPPSDSKSGFISSTLTNEWMNAAFVWDDLPMCHSEARTSSKLSRPFYHSSLSTPEMFLGQEVQSRWCLSRWSS